MLSEKAGKDFGGMCKTVKSKKIVGKESDKCCAYDKNYHYPSSDGFSPNIDGGNGQEQPKQPPEYHNGVQP